MPYKVMNDEEIMDFPIHDFADENCDLFMWLLSKLSCGGLPMKKVNVLDEFAKTISSGTFKGEKLYFESWKEMFSYMKVHDMIYGESYEWLSKLDKFLQGKVK